MLTHVHNDLEFILFIVNLATSKTLVLEVWIILHGTYFIAHTSLLDLRSANLTPSTPPQSPKRLTRSPPPLSTSVSNSSTTEDSSEDGEAEHRKDDFPTSSLVTRSQDTLPASISFPPTAPSSLSFGRRNSQPTGTSPAPGSTTRPIGPTKSYSARLLSPTSTGGNTIRPSSPTTTGVYTASAPTYLRANTTGPRYDTPLRPSVTGSAKRTFGPSPGFEGTPNCPRCGQAVYFAEQVCQL